MGAALLLSVVAAVLMVSSAVANAAPAWRVTSVHGPQSMAPNGTGQYLIEMWNIGDADATNSQAPITMVDTLPPGVTAQAVSATAWICHGIGTRTVTCLYNGFAPTLGIVTAPGSDATRRGAAPPIFITVHVSGSVAPAGDNTATMSGGGAATVSTTDHTPLDGAPTAFGPVADTLVMDVFDGELDTALPERQAGAHPFEYRVQFSQSLTFGQVATTGQFFTAPLGHIKNLETTLPVGMIGDPQAVPQCKQAQLNDGGPATFGSCPTNTQVGTADITLQDGPQLVTSAQTASPDVGQDVPVYNVTPSPGAAATFAMTINSVPILINAHLVKTPGGEYTVQATVSAETEAILLRSVSLTLWGVPGDPAHDHLRAVPDPVGPASAGSMEAPFTGAPIKPFLTLPSDCDETTSTQLRMNSWQAPGQLTQWLSGAPMQVRNCGDPRFRFEPTITVQPESHSANTPTALDVDLNVPQKDDTVENATDLYAQSGKDVAIPTPPMRNAVVLLPPGMAVSPSSADGLAACSALQVGLDNQNEPTCPNASKLGKVSIKTPLLPGPLEGSIYLAAQGDNPFGTLLAIYLVAEGPGVLVKLPGKIEPDPATGQLKTTFSDNPQLPFSDLHLQFTGGPRAALVTPSACGTYTTNATMTSWNSTLPAAQSSDSFTIAGNCAKTFDPTFAAGTVNPIAGKDSPLVTRFTRSDSDEDLSRIDVTMPQGLLGRIANVDLCDDAAANAGTCSDASRIGTASVGAGPGSNPFFITDGRVYITGPYKGAPFGLSIVVHAKAGPLDLGNVVVRAQVLVDRKTAVLRIVSDPLPTILRGIPLDVRVVDVTVDRPGFTFNPTSCAEKRADAVITSTTGRTSAKSSRFQVGDCAALPFKPKLTLRVGGRRHTKKGQGTPLTAVVKSSPGQANLKAVKVSLPTTINARLPVVTNACTLAEFNAGKCAKSKTGTAVAVTPLLRDPLRGNVYFVKNGGPLPDLMVALKGQVDFDLDGKVKIAHGKRLGTNFNTIPDVPITKFTLRLVSGRKGAIGAVTNLCRAASRKKKAAVTFKAQSGKVVRTRKALTVKGCAKAKKAKTKKARKHRKGSHKKK